MEFPRRAPRSTISSLSPLLAFLVASACLVCRCSASSSGADPTPVSSLTLSSQSLHGNRASDREALLAFRSAVAASDPMGRAMLPIWNDNSDFCGWRGVTCGGRRHPDRVTGLDLRSLGLSGPIPTSVTNLTFLRMLDLSDNSFHGRIPEEFGRLPRLRVLNLEFNSLEDEIPASLGRCTQLQNVTLRWNSLSGALPTSLSNLSSLRSLDLSKNRLRGSIPPQLGGIATLVFLDLKENDLTGSIPASFGNLTRLGSLSLARNSLSGTIPSSVCNLSSLDILDLRDNQFSGNIQSGIGDLVGLDVLALGNNLINGAIPPAIGKLQNLGLLDLTNNQLSGQIPSSIFNLTRMYHFSIEMNQLTGVLSPSFGKLQNLQKVYLSANEFSGTTPKELFNISHLTLLDMSQNSLTGTLPAAIQQLKNILVNVDVHGNNLQGKIPQSFSRLRRLEMLDVSMNNLSGNIPGFLQEFRYLSYLNLSFNDFDGEAPNGGIFQDARAVSLLGNPKLCGRNNSQFLHQLDPCFGGESKRPHRRPLLTAAITLASVSPCTILVIVLCVIFSRRSKRRRRRSSPLPMVHPKEMLPRVTYDELFKATQGFSPCNLIGAGSFGSVYEGKLDPADPTIRRSVAVKVINLGRQHGASKSFLRECEALRSVRHRNLVKILTSCSSVDFHGNDFKALVFEFMPNGSLEQWLHPRDINDYYCAAQLGLAQRLNIAVDVALAISYLHSHNSRPIVHRDLKPSNVLLDDEMVAHVSDFGLARFLPTNRDGRSKNLISSSSLALQGSIGYVAPEYGMGCKASTEGDVYSYGILLLEMVTGRRPTDVMFVGDLTLRRYVQMAFPDRVLDVVDPSLLLREGTDQNNNNAVHRTSISPESMNECLVKEEEARLACLASMLRLGLTCSKDSPKERIQMEAVVKEMTAVRERFLASF